MTNISAEEPNVPRKMRERYEAITGITDEFCQEHLNEEFEHIFRDGDGWARFRREFPESDGTLRFSRVGFDQDVTQAILYAGQQFDWNLGSGGFWLFSKLDGEWTEAGRAGSWLS